MAEKECGECHAAKSVSEFHKDRQRKDCLAFRCKTCKSEQAKRHYAANADRIKARTRADSLAHPQRTRRYAREWGRRNSESVAATGRAWYAANRERSLAYSKAWQATNREHVAELARAWAANNPERRRAGMQRRRAARHAADHGCVTGQGLRDLLGKHTGECHYCGDPLGADMHWDHKTPLSKGGLHCLDNLAPTCPPCNLRKWTRTEAEFFEMLNAEPVAS